MFILGFKVLRQMKKTCFVTLGLKLVRYSLVLWLRGIYRRIHRRRNYEIFILFGYIWRVQSRIASFDCTINQL